MMPLVTLILALFSGGVPAQVTFTTIAEGQQSNVEDAREVVVRSAAEWKTLWQQHAPDQPMPKVDFAKSMVIGVFLGSRSTGGYRATISAVDRDGAGLVVTWREERPGPDAIVSQMLTFPYHVVRVDRSSGPVKFRRATASG
jgi:PrcB C-terminal